MSLGHCNAFIVSKCCITYTFPTTLSRSCTFTLLVTLLASGTTSSLVKVIHTLAAKFLLECWAFASSSEKILNSSIARSTHIRVTGIELVLHSSIAKLIVGMTPILPPTRITPSNKNNTIPLLELITPAIAHTIEAIQPYMKHVVVLFSCRFKYLLCPGSYNFKVNKNFTAMCSGCRSQGERMPLQIRYTGYIQKYVVISLIL